jgi:hypothetical protein
MKIFKEYSKEKYATTDSINRKKVGGVFDEYKYSRLPSLQKDPDSDS